MRLVPPLLYSLVSPFHPKCSFRHFETEENKPTTATISFIVGIAIILGVYLLGPTRGPQYEPLSRLFNVLGFGSGVILRHLFFAYLIWLFFTRAGLGTIKWAEAFALVSFSLLPSAVGLLWSMVDTQRTGLGPLIGTIWSAAIIILGLGVLKGIKLWKGAVLVTGILVVVKLAEVALTGIRV